MRVLNNVSHGTFWVFVLVEILGVLGFLDLFLVIGQGVKRMFHMEHLGFLPHFPY